MSAAKSGRKVVKANRAARSKPDTKTLLRPSALPSADFAVNHPSPFPRDWTPEELVVAHKIEMATDEFVLDLQRKQYRLVFALRGALHFYDRVTGVSGCGEGWTAADVLYLEEIRNLAWGVPITVNSSPVTPQTPPSSYVQPSKPKKAPQIGS